MNLQDATLYLYSDDVTNLSVRDCEIIIEPLKGRGVNFLKKLCVQVRFLNCNFHALLMETLGSMNKGVYKYHNPQMVIAVAEILSYGIQQLRIERHIAEQQRQEAEKRRKAREQADAELRKRNDAERLRKTKEELERRKRESAAKAAKAAEQKARQDKLIKVLIKVMLLVTAISVIWINCMAFQYDMYIDWEAMK